MRDYDVLVVGGGNAGCAAALAAARNGRACSWSSATAFWGDATASMVGPWMTFHSGDDRIVGGSRRRWSSGSSGSAGRPDTCTTRRTTFRRSRRSIRDPQGAAVRDDGESGVGLLLHAWFSMRRAGVTLLRRASQRSRDRRVSARRTIDATADAYVAASAGVPTQQGDARGRVQPASLMFRLSHVDLAALSMYVRQRPEQMRSSLKTHERTRSR